MRLNEWGGLEGVRSIYRVRDARVIPNSPLKTASTCRTGLLWLEQGWGKYLRGNVATRSRRADSILVQTSATLETTQLLRPLAQLLETRKSYLCLDDQVQNYFLSNPTTIMINANVEIE
jgi:hypothetical protein